MLNFTTALMKGCMLVSSAISVGDDQRLEIPSHCMDGFDKCESDVRVSWSSVLKVTQTSA